MISRRGLPGQQKYLLEMSSCTNCDRPSRPPGDMRFRAANPATANPKPVHTLNGSGLAVGRGRSRACSRHYQQADGSVLIPRRLRPTWVERKPYTFSLLLVVSAQ